MPADSAPPPIYCHDKARALALRLAEAENALLTFTGGQVDAIVDIRGRPYLLRPAQECLRRNETRLQGLFDSLADVITVLDGAGEVTHQSPAVTRMLAYQPGALVGRRLVDLVHVEDLYQVETAFSEVHDKSGLVTRADFRILSGDGTWQHVEATAAAMQATDAPGIILTLRDATDRKAAQDTSKDREAVSSAASLSKDRFLAMLSHELRTPLTPAMLGLHLLEEDARFEEGRPTIQMIRRCLNMQERLIAELMDFVRLGHHKIHVSLEALDAHSAVRCVLDICASDIAAANLHVLFDLRATESMVLADQIRFQQVMWSLLKNAAKFSPPQGSITITSFNDTPETLTLEFSDQGIGIEPSMLPLIFDPFQQGTHSGPKRHEGLGLGLFIAKGLAEAQHGSLSVASEGRGKGATFRLTLPTAPGQESRIHDCELQDAK